MSIQSPPAGVVSGASANATWTAKVGSVMARMSGLMASPTPGATYIGVIRPPEGPDPGPGAARTGFRAPAGPLRPGWALRGSWRLPAPSRQVGPPAVVPGHLQQQGPHPVGQLSLGDHRPGHVEVDDRGDRGAPAPAERAHAERGRRAAPGPAQQPG